MGLKVVCTNREEHHHVTSFDLGILAPAVAVIAGIMTIFTVAIYPMIRKVQKLTAGWDDFMRDWKGDVKEPGRDAAPGVMERLNDIDGEFNVTHMCRKPQLIVKDTTS